MSRTLRVLVLVVAALLPLRAEAALPDGWRDDLEGALAGGRLRGNPVLVYIRSDEATGCDAWEDAMRDSRPLREALASCPRVGLDITDRQNREAFGAARRFSATRPPVMVLVDPARGGRVIERWTTLGDPTETAEAIVAAIEEARTPPDAPPEPVRREHDIPENGGRYVAYLPADWETAAPEEGYPLLFTMHATNQGGWAPEPSAATAAGFLLVAAEARGRRWTEDWPEGNRDALEAALIDVASRYPVHPRHRFVAGFGNGAFAAGQLLYEGRGDFLGGVLLGGPIPGLHLGRESGWPSLGDPANLEGKIVHFAVGRGDQNRAVVETCAQKAEEAGVRVLCRVTAETGEKMLPSEERLLVDFLAILRRMVAADGPEALAAVETTCYDGVGNPMPEIGDFLETIRESLSGE